MSAWTAEQLAAIERRRGDLLLDAGAGSGKTSVLVERFASSVLSDGIEVSAILVITFTDKAAAELRARIRARLRALGAVEQARATEGASISTIHGFCARVLRSGALAAGLDPRFEVLDETRAGRLSALAFERALSELAARDPQLVELIAAYGLPALRAATTGVYEQLRSSGMVAPRLPEVAVAADDGSARLAAAANAALAELAAVPDPGVRVTEALARVAAARELALAGGGAAAVWPPALGRLALRNGAAALSTDACEEYRAALAAFRFASGAAAAVGVRDVLDALLVGYGDCYAQAKRDASAVDFEDLELGARELLRSDDALRERYAQRFEAIMVDEQQDTNAVQLSLIESIARDNLFTVGDAQQSIYGFRHADVDLFAARGRTLAGRGARITLATNFRSRPSILEAINRGFADELSGELIVLRAGRDAAASPSAGGDESLPVGAGPEPCNELLLVDKGADWELEGIAAPWRLAEAEALARRIAELIAAGTAPGDVVVLLRAMTDVRVYERALERAGLPTYVIGGRGYWDHPQIVDLVCYLRALDNPLDEEALYGVLASPLAGVSLDALVLLSDGVRETGRDPWSLIRSCESALAGLEGPAGLAGLEAGDRSRLAAFVDWFCVERERAARCPADELIDGALNASGYDRAMLQMPGGIRRLANVRKLMRLAREHQALHGPDLHELVVALADRAADGAGAREGEAPVEGEGLDVIRLMTIHRAKGLEFHTVCVADLGRSVAPRAPIVYVAGDAGDGRRLGLRLARAGEGGRESALDYKTLRQEEIAASDREERRLFYVAMTRARERLVLSGAARFAGWLDGSGRVGGGPVAWIAPAFVPQLRAVLEDGGGEVLLGGARLAVRIAQPESDEGAVDGARRGDAVAERACADVVHLASACAKSDASRPGSGSSAPAVQVAAAAVQAEAAHAVGTLSYSALEQYRRCGYRFYAERVLGLAPVAPAGGGGGGGERVPGPSGAERGTLVHALLERLSFRRPLAPSTAAVHAAAARSGIEPAPGPAQSDELIALVRRFTESELCARLGRATSVRREQRFAFGLAAGTLVVGALDVLAREPGGRSLVIDYKTDRLAGLTPEQAAGRYELQRLIYAIAVLRAGAASVQIAHCFLEAPDEPVLSAVEHSQLPQLSDRLERVAAGVLGGRFEVSPEPHAALCSGCPAQGGLCSWPEAMTRRAAADTLF